ncbi:MAG: hypothetical protein DMG81_18260 [Acidobacteria bacterium]|nr:MAG: hypothetical protein DMG81_18260 [Acidobacteriota bacterium]
MCQLGPLDANVITTAASSTDKTGLNIAPEQAPAHYKVHALGFASNVTLPARKVSLGVRYFKEFSNRSTFQGYSLQISGAVSF